MNQWVDTPGFEHITEVGSPNLTDNPLPFILGKFEAGLSKSRGTPTEPPNDRVVRDHLTIFRVDGLQIRANTDFYTQLK